MDEETCQKLAGKLYTFPENIVREEYEMIFLKSIIESKWGKKIFFKGGTALRLCYHSVRFSEDLDFALLGKISWPELKNILRKEADSLEAVKIKDLKEKYYTYFGLLSIKEPFLPQPFLLKIEISKRPVSWKKEIDYRLKQLESPVTPLRASGFVVTLKRATLDKKRAVKERVKGRDWYDLWWLGQKLGQDRVKVNGRFNSKAVACELKRFLPKSSWLVVDELTKKIK